MVGVLEQVALDPSGCSPLRRRSIDIIEACLGHLFRDTATAELRKSEHLVETVDSGNAVALWHEVDDWRLPPLAMVFDIADGCLAIYRSHL